MLELTNINMDEFAKTVYSEYIKLFPACERKPYELLENTYNKGILKIIKILDDGDFIGFVMTNSVKDNKYLLLDYYAILPKYQNKGYGTKVLETLRDNSCEYSGIFIEVDKEGLGIDDKENKLRKRRIEFYERLGFHKLNFDLDLYNNIFTPYILPTTDKKENIEDGEKILKDIFQIYEAIMGKERAKNNCKVIYRT